MPQPFTLHSFISDGFLDTTLALPLADKILNLASRRRRSSMAGLLLQLRKSKGRDEKSPALQNA